MRNWSHGREISSPVIRRRRWFSIVFLLKVRGRNTWLGKLKRCYLEASLQALMKLISRSIAWAFTAYQFFSAEQEVVTWRLRGKALSCRQASERASLQLWNSSEFAKRECREVRRWFRKESIRGLLWRGLCHQWYPAGGGHCPTDTAFQENW